MDKLSAKVPTVDRESNLSNHAKQCPHHLTQALFSVTFGASFSLLAWCVWKPGGRFYYYNVPIAVPFAAFVFESIVKLRDSGFIKKAMAGIGFDVLVLSVAIARAFYPIPLFSGHVLFTTYAVFSGRSLFLRIVAGVVLIQVVFSKFVLWGDGQTVWGGFLLAILCVLGRKRLMVVVGHKQGGNRDNDKAIRLR